MGLGRAVAAPDPEQEIVRTRAEHFTQHTQRGCTRLASAELDEPERAFGDPARSSRLRLRKPEAQASCFYALARSLGTRDTFWSDHSATMHVLRG